MVEPLTWPQVIYDIANSAINMIQLVALAYITALISQTRTEQIEVRRRLEEHRGPH